MSVGRVAMCRCFVVSGRVQGVWFRDSTRREAAALGLKGFAENLPDGTVRVLACGEPAAIAALEQWLHDGPPMARVEAVVEVPAADDAPDGFHIG